MVTKAKLILLCLLAFGITAQAQTLDLGFERHDRFNQMNSWDSIVVMDVIDVEGDTLEVTLPNAKMGHNGEWPIYARINFKNRLFISVGYGVTNSRIELRGGSNYNETFYDYVEPSFWALYNDDNLGLSREEFWDMFWHQYYENEVKIWRSSVTYIEEIKQRSIHLNIGYRFFPHKPIRPYVLAGFTYRSKFRNSVYQVVQFNNDFVQDLEDIYSGIANFRQHYGYARLGIGFETYRFRFGVQGEIGLGFPQAYADGSETVLPRIGGAIYERPYSLIVNIGANLFTADLTKSKDLHSLEDKTNLVETKKFHKRRKAWEIGARFGNPIFANVTNRGYDDQPFSVVNYVYTPSFGFNDTVIDEYSIEAFTLRNVKRVNWSPKFELLGRYIIWGRLSGETSIGASQVTVDNQTTDMNTRVIDNGDGTWEYVFDVGATKIRSGVFRNSFLLMSFGQQLGLNVYDGQDFLINLFGGVSFNQVWTSFSLEEKIPGVNSLTVHEKFHDYFYNENDDNGGNLYFIEEDVHLDNFADAKDLSATITNTQFDIDAVRDEQERHLGFGSVRAGAEVQFDQFTIGATYEQSVGEVDRLVYSDTRTIMLCFGFLWGR